MQIATRPGSVPNAVDETISFHYWRVAQQLRRVNDARARIAMLERNGQSELIRSSHRFLTRMEGVLSKARDDFKLAVQRRAAWLNSRGA